MGSRCNNNTTTKHRHVVHGDEDDSWEVRAFEEDTVGCCSTWPPRSYTCSFCRREFRSAQALGGHMNVHRRDRARLHRLAPRHPPTDPTMPRPDFASGNALCILYPIIPDHTVIFIPAPPAPTPPYLLRKIDDNPNDAAAASSNGNSGSAAMEEVDLELRLGR